MEAFSEVQCIAISLPAQESRLSQQYLALKRVLDVVLASALLLVVSPILLLLCAAVMLESPGAPLYRQRRVGVGGQIFRIFKLRTMYTGTDGMSHVTGDTDNRVTRIGSFLRSSKLDELPQLLNIIKGDMSVIGPRPLSESECNHMVSDEGINWDTPGFVPQQRPGLIGLEQVTRSQRKDWRSYGERFELNAQYESNISWQMDFDILVRAVIQCRVVVYAAIIAFSSESVVLSLLN